MTDVKNTTQSEQELIALAQKSPQAFEPLYLFYYMPIYKYVYMRTPSKEDCQDVTALVFEKAMQKIALYKPQGYAFSAWLFQIARHEISNFYRSTNKTRVSVISEQELAQLGGTMHEYWEGEQHQKMSDEQLMNALQKIDPEDLELIEWRFFEGRSHQEIAGILDITEGNVRVKMHRALQTLKNYLV